MQLLFNRKKQDFYIDGINLRDFYIKTRQERGMPIGKLEEISWLKHPTLYNIEHATKFKRSNSTRAMLAALQVLGYDVVLVKRPIISD